MGALPFIEITPALDAAGHGRCIYLRGVSGAKAGTELLSDEIRGLYFGVPASHGLRVGDQLRMDLDPVGLVDAEVILVAPDMVGCRFAEPIRASDLFPGKAARVAAKADAAGEDLGMRLAQYRRAKGMTLAQLAERLGVSVPAICAWEKNKSRPKYKRLEMVADALDVTVPDLLGLSEQMSLPDLILNSRHQIASAAGVSPDKIDISIRL
ncbi:helix-turn-helix domain-containing protein [Sphingopyxis flava]|uniref:Helix-turn-helix domain-containing protein n=1 Tax=Sphingopyxis flava TaxID=1507287 RepID=A0A1T5FJA7_9SPHN|nr:helix-turn-helix transcriptional regulator [Sphingopyxis flava]SKB96225.1 Helix-turn-helix domain-containing protein [Sphingopyxis flava]